MSTSASFSGLAYSRTGSSSRAVGLVALDQLDEPRAGDRIELDAGVERAHELGVAPRIDGRLVASRPMRRLRVAWTAASASGAITPTTGTGSSAWSCGQRRRGGRVAGDDDQLHALALEERARSRARSRGSPRSGRGP